MSATPVANEGLWLRMMPGVFVLIWSTGFIVAKYGLPYSGPLWFLNLRFVGVIIALLIALPFMPVPWPSRREAIDIAIAGVLLQAGYLGGVWVAISEGMPAGLAALIVGLQPVATALAAPLVGERVSGRQWIGFALGFVGVGLVVADKIGPRTDASMPWSSVVLDVGALVAITIGTLYQKSRCPRFDLRAGTLIQFTASLCVTIPLAILFEPWRLQLTPQFVGAWAWSVFGLSLAGMALLFPLIRRGEATRVTSLFYLTPPVTAMIAWFVFGEALGQRALLGMGVAVVGVALVVSKR